MMDCDIVKDLMPLYVEGLVSDKSKEALEDHFKECTKCQELCQSMKTPEPKVTFHKDSAKSFKKYVTKKKFNLGWKIALLSGVVVMAIVIWRLIAIGGLMGFLVWDSVNTEIIQDNDVTNYADYMGENAKEEYISKWGMDESIFPVSISENMDVKEYKMVYYNPWDAQFLSYLTVEYSDEDFEKELERLADCSMDEYEGYYGVEGFAPEYTLLAMEADEYQGFVYAISEGDNEITYVEIIFCNYFMDLEYWNYINNDYLPIGFDATMDNPYEKQMMGEL